MSAAMPLLEIRRVTKSYRPPGGAPPISVLRDASLTVHSGESVAIIGPSGSGKSTLLNLIGGLDQPDDGSILLDGIAVSKLDEAALAQMRRDRIGFVFQSHHLLPHCSVLENVLVPVLADRSSTDSTVEQRARHLLERVGLGNRIDQLPGRLSGGERQRAAVVRAIIRRPALLLADEPTGALDRASALEIGRLLADLNGIDSVTLLVVTHSRELAGQLGRIVEMHDGQLVEA
jgi:ABC-type lipoprotein export system ATPase subunit